MLDIDNPAARAWLEDSLGSNTPEGGRYLSLTRSSRIVFVAAFTSIVTVEGVKSAYLSYAAELNYPWATEEHLTEMWTFAFDTLELDRVVGQIDAQNTQALAFANSMGCRIITNTFTILPNDNLGQALSYTALMTRDICRWLN